MPAADALPARIPDDKLEDLANEYRKHCGKNDVLIRKDWVVPFDYFLLLNLSHAAMDDAVVLWRFKQEQRKRVQGWKRLLQPLFS
jgi:hypothetical protein